jgi:hypothetical protein
MRPAVIWWWAKIANLIDGGNVTGVTVSGDPSNADVHIRTKRAV